MKRLPFLIFLVFSFSIVIITTIKVSQQIDEPASTYLVQKVINYGKDDINVMILEPSTFNDYYLLFDQYKLNTKQFIGLFSFLEKGNYEYQIMALYPYLNPLYKNKLIKIESVGVKAGSLGEVLAEFYQIYRSELDYHNLDWEVETSVIKGVPLRLVKINTSNEALYYFLNKYPLIKYSLQIDGLFKTI